MKSKILPIYKLEKNKNCIKIEKDKDSRQISRRIEAGVMVDVSDRG